MTHTVTASRDYAPTIDPSTALYANSNDGHGTPTAKAGSWNQPVLTVRSALTAREVSILFTEDEIVINPWGDGRTVAISGEDLFALRELLLNEVDESAFQRPADPVEKVEPWEVGDKIACRGISTYTRVAENIWVRISNREGLTTDVYTDELIDKYVSDGYIVIRRGGVDL